MNRRGFLVSAAASLGLAGLVAPRRSDAAPGDAKNLIVVLAVGGWDVTYCFDPKLSCSQPDGSGCFIEGPEVDQSADPEDREAVRTFGNIPIVVNPYRRPAVSSFFERWSSRSHVLNGVWTGSIAHDPCRYRILTGTPDGTRPDLATIAGFVNGGERPLGSVDLSGWSISGPLAATSGRVGFMSQLQALLDPDTTFRAPFAAAAPYPLYRASGSDQEMINAMVQDRAEAMRARYALGQGGRSQQAVDDLIGSLGRSERFREQAGGILGLLEMGTQSRFPSQIAMAVDLLDQEVCRSVTIDTVSDWDTHDGNANQHGYYELLFSGLDQLMTSLEAKGRLDDTVVAVVSEMTRTPLRNSAGGKDHWGHTSAMLLGSVRGNAVSGGTDHYLESMPVDLETGALDAAGTLNKYDNVCAGVLEMVGVDPEEWLPGVLPFRGAAPG